MSREHPAVAVDLPGSDLGPEEIAEGVRRAMKRLKDVTILPIGPEEYVRSLMGDAMREDCITDVATSTKDGPATILRGTNASVAIAARMVADGRADGMISFGDTKAAVVWATWPADRDPGGIGLLPGVKRAPLALVVPAIDEMGTRKKVVVMDAGANADVAPETLVEFAHLGKAFSEATILSGRPAKIGLLSNGEESSKGNDLSRRAFKLLEDGVEGFRGNIQGSDVLRGLVDVVVTDGFSGNVWFKASEGGVEITRALLKYYTKRSLLAIIGMFLARGALNAVKRTLAPEEFGSMPLLGLVKGVVMIGHGAANARAVERGIEETARYVRLGLTEKIKNAMGGGDQE